LIWNIKNTEVVFWKQTVPIPEKQKYSTEELFGKTETQSKIVPAGSIKLDKPAEDIFDKIQVKGKDEPHDPWEKYQNKGSPKVEYLGPLKNSNYDPLGLYRTETIYYAIPCNVFFGTGIILMATGIGLVVCSPKR
jgi:hypothetical protein